MIDSGYAESEYLLKQMEYRIKQHYGQAQKELEEKVNKFYKDFQRLDDKKLKDVNDGKITMDAYKKWRQGKIMSGKVWEQRKDSIATDLYHANDIAHSMIYGYMADVYAANHNFATYQIEQGARIDTGYVLYNREAVEKLIAEEPDLLPYQRINEALDKRWNKKNIQSVMIQGILQGESIPHLAKRLSKTMYQKNRAAAIRNARTMTTAAQNAGKYDAMERAASLGVKMKTQWRAVLDDRTRDRHRELDGVTVELGEEFPNGLRYPADIGRHMGEISAQSAEGKDICAETYNCRCNIKPIIDGLEPRAEKYRSNDAVGIPYEEWKKGHKAANEYRKTQGMKPHDRKGNEYEPRKNKPALKNTNYSENITNTIMDSYDNHIKRNGLNLIPFSQLDKEDRNINVNMGKMDEKTVKEFSEALRKLTTQYDSTIIDVGIMGAKETLNNSSFAYVYHDYRMDNSTMRINILKCGNYDKMVNRMKELKAARYMPQIREGTEGAYIITHEFAHTLIEMRTPLEKNKNWAGADYARIKRIRKEIDGVYSDYLKDMKTLENAWRVAEKEFKEVELQALNTLDAELWEKAPKLDEIAKAKKAEYEAARISAYSLTNSDEFMAESFAMSQLSDEKNVYANRVMEIINREFKR